MNLESTVGMESMFDKVWRLINSTDDKPIRNIIGLYGQGGVGKTTLLKKINNQFHKISTGEHGFDYIVIFLLVSKPINYKAMQKKIGERLGLSNSLQGDRDEKSRAQKIFNALKKKDYVLLLDDIREKVDKKRIGIPIHPQGNSKLIFTTRSERVCGKMKATHTFQVECLSWDKAWSLFQDKVGEKALNYLSEGGAHELATDVGKECGGLPLALITIGRAMSTKKSVQDWRDAIATLRRYASDFKDARDKVLACLKLSYDNLPDETEKSCFRYCALFPEDYSIQIAKLVDLWIAEGFLNGFDKLDEARNRGHTIIGSLKSACLLESSSGEDHVKMHDVIRDLALWIVNNCSSTTNQSRINPDNKFLVVFNGPCKKWENAERIFWDADRSSNVGENPPTSPNLQTLLVQNMDIIGYCGLPTFFQHMPLLRVLNLSNTFCVDGEFPISICELHELQYLNLSGTFIKELPVELRKLVKLKFLVLNNTYWLRRIPAGLIANLSELQVLDTGCEDDSLGFDDWELEDRPSFSELDGLKQLQEVRIAVTTYVAFDKFLCNLKLQMVCTGLNVDCSSSSSSSSRRLVLDLSNFKSLKDLVLYGFPELEELVLYGSTTDGRLLSNIERLSVDVFLKKLVVRNCEGQETTIEGEKISYYKIIEGEKITLEYILMYGLPKLKSICINIQKLKKKPLNSRSNITLQKIQEEEDDTIKTKFLPYIGQGTNLMLSRRTEKVSVKPECVEIIAAEVNKNLQKDDDQRETSKQTEQVVVRPQSIEIIAAEVNKNLQKDDDQRETSKQTEQVVVRPQSIETIAAEVNEKLQKDDDQHETSKQTEQVVVRPQSIEIIAAEVNENLQKDDDQHETCKQTEQVVVRPQSIEIIATEVNENLQKDDDQHETSKPTEQLVVRPQSIEIIATEVNENLQKDDDQHETSKPTEQVVVRPQRIEIIAAEVNKNLQKDDDQHETSKQTEQVVVRPQSIEIIATEVNENLQKDDDQHETSKPTEQVVVRPQSIEIIAAEVNKNLQKDDDQHETSKQTEQVVVRPQSIDIIAAEMDKNLQKDDDQHEPGKHTEEVAVSLQSINIIAANMDTNLQEIATRPQTVEIIAAEVDKNFQKDYHQISKGNCLRGFFPKNCWSSNYKKKLGKLVAQKKMPKVENLEMKQKSLGMAGYMFEKAWSLLGEDDDDDDEIRIMGLYGQGGVGKTTLLKQINNEFIKSRYQRGLDIVILVLVSKPIKVEVIQKKIAESLKLSLEGDERRRAEEIFKVLKNKNFVLLLDDIWERIDLQCIGVPRPQGKSKIIFTTRLKIVCQLMEADKTFKVECLPWNKAWSLFQENVGDEALNSDPRVPELAKIITRECAGLPLALITIGRAMSSKKSLQEWNDTITTLREFGSGCSGICDEGFSHLKVSYDNLHSETIKSCFLYCSLYPEHHSIPKSQLIDFWIGEGIFQWVDDIDEVRNRAYDIIENLKSAFLLESGEDEETNVKMHDVIRDLALWIVNEFGRRKDKSLVERATGTPNTSDKWENAERIYLSVDIDTKQEEEEEEIQNDIQMETPPRSPNLSTLMVHGNSYYADLFLSQNFFQFMPLLRVLDFSELEMEEFPRSITELVELQYLGLAKTNIEALPDELRKLEKLKYLDLSHTYFLKKIPPGVIASLSELRVFNEYHSDFGDWEEDGPSLRELTSLSHLDDLGITIETVLALQRLLRNRKLRMCTSRLTIDECINLKSLALLSSSTATTLSLGNLKRLKELACQNCSALAELTMNWAVVEDGQKGLLSNLETLTLWNLPKLNVVWEKQYVCSSFQSLKEISIVGCNALKDLTWLVYVRNLKTLYLRKCQEVKEILGVDGFGRGDEMLTRDVVFKELKNICLGNLVRLESICKHALAFPSLKSIVVEDCPHLKKLPLDCDSNVNNTLQRIEGGATWWNQLDWEDDQVKSKFLPYFEE